MTHHIEGAATPRGAKKERDTKMLSKNCGLMQAQLHPQDAEDLKRLPHLEGDLYKAERGRLENRILIYYASARKFLKLKEPDVADKYYEWAKVLDVALRREAVDRSRQAKKADPLAACMPDLDEILLTTYMEFDC